MFDPADWTAEDEEQYEAEAHEEFKAAPPDVRIWVYAGCLLRDPDERGLIDDLLDEPADLLVSIHREVIRRQSSGAVMARACHVVAAVCGAAVGSRGIA